MRHHTSVDSVSPGQARIAVSFRGVLLLLCLLSGAFSVEHARAQAYPNRPIRVLVPLDAGGPVDALMRNLSQIVSESIGQPMTIVNIPGASSQIELAACAKAPPDGYTICENSMTGMSYGPLLFSNLPYDTEKDFAPITNLVMLQGIIVANKDVPFNNIREMIAYARAKPGVLNMGSWGVASTAHIYLEWIKNQTGADIVHVPYKGGGNPVIAAMLAGDVHVGYLATGLILPLIKAGKVKPIVAATSQRSRFLPDVPTLAEHGLDPGGAVWFGLFAPSRTPKPIIDRLNAEYVKALRNPVFQERFLELQAYDAAGSSPAEFAEFLKADRAAAARLIKIIGLKPEHVGAQPGPAAGSR
ncbi:MAG: tripartite tricarboxylate transporter substrate binding protein [Betaproteobacteria bacterium]|nr:tripartite tricarboxylate transporter substrate binding protein [Betaproteobacteria bacterium]